MAPKTRLTASNNQPPIPSSQAAKRSTNRTPKHDLQATKRRNVQPQNFASQPAKQRSYQSPPESNGGNTNKRKCAQELSDDDFVAEKLKRGKLQKESTRPLEHGNNNNEPDTMFHPLHCRICPTVLVETIEQLSENQKQQVCLMLEVVSSNCRIHIEFMNAFYRTPNVHRFCECYEHIFRFL